MRRRDRSAVLRRASKERPRRWSGDSFGGTTNPSRGTPGKNRHASAGDAERKGNGGGGRNRGYPVKGRGGIFYQLQNGEGKPQAGERTSSNKTEITGSRKASIGMPQTRFW